MKYLKLAFSFLTIFPMRLDESIEIKDLNRSAGWFPFIGFFIGGFVVLMKWGASFLFSPLVSSVLALAIWVALSGGLHLDGLADCFDGMCASATPERRLEIMKDPRLGTFGGVGLVLTLVLKIALLAALPAAIMPLAILSATTLGRWMVLLGARLKQARPTGLGTAFSTGLKWQSYILAGLLPIVMSVSAGVQGLAALAAVHVTGFLVLRSAKRRLGGMTGDVFGLLIELSEVVVLAVFAIQPS